MTIYLKQSTASQEVPLGYFVDSADGNTEETSLTIANTDIKVWKTGATTLADKNSGGATHISNGIYYAVLDATDTNTLGPLVLFVHVSGALAVRVECCVLAANIYDSLIGGGDVLQVDVTQYGGTNATTSSGRPEVNTTHIAGSSVSTSAAQIGVNVVNAGGTAWASGAITASVLASDTITAAKVASDVSAEIADAVWDEATSGHAISGSTGEALSAAGSAGDPWTTSLPGSYSSGQAGYIIGTYINASVSSRSTLDAAGIRTAVGLASANLDTQLDTLPTAAENADALLGRNVSGGSSTGRLVKEALHFLRNKWTVSGGTLTVYDTDDSTSSWTSTVTGTAGADPVTGSDPA